MVIILCLYIVAIWLVFSKFKVVRWGSLSGTISVFVGAFILATFLRFLTISTVGRSDGDRPGCRSRTNVQGQIVAIPVKPNAPVKMGDVLFQIDTAPFQFKVNHLRAALAAAQPAARGVKSSYEQATRQCCWTGGAGQIPMQEAPEGHSEHFYESGANTEFREQDTQVPFETMSAQLGAARAAQQSAKLALNSEIGGVNTTVAQVQAQLEKCRVGTVRGPGFDASRRLRDPGRR